MWPATMAIKKCLRTAHWSISCIPFTFGFHPNGFVKFQKREFSMPNLVQKFSRRVYTKMKTIADYGSWKSDIDAEAVTFGNCRSINELQISEDSAFWIEQQFAEGRCSVFQFKNGKTIEWTPPGFSVRNSVHEYGGGSFVAVDDHIYFVTSDGIYLQKQSEIEPTRIAESSKLCRYADLCYSNGNLYAVNEKHLENCPNKVENLLTRISKDGSVITIASGADFYACPRVSGDGCFIAWMEWNLPFMPWDETTIKVAQLDAKGDIGKVIATVSKKNVNFHGVQWGPESELFVISDETGWWNVYSVDIHKSELKKNIHPVEAEIGSPPWLFGDRQFVIEKTGALLNISGKLVFQPPGGEWKTIRIDSFEQFSHLALAKNNIAFCIASGPSRCSSVLKINLNNGEVQTIRESRDSKEIERYDISLPKMIVFPSDDVAVFGWFYSPYSKSSEAPKDTLPPLLLIAHGGPTTNASNSLSMKIQFFTSRGFAVFDVNYRGSTGYGTKFRNLLRGKWGVVDRNDMVNAAKYLIERRMVDPKKVCIMGSSAGGYLILSAVLSSNIFAAAASLYGVSDLVGLCKETHKFEQGYNEQLIGKYPEEADIYEQRSPINKAKELNLPICFFHGTEDAVVPLSQSVTLYETIKAKGLPTALVVFPGEGHGFRGLEATKMSINGVYYFFCRVLRIPPSIFVQIPIDNLQHEQAVFEESKST